MQVAVLAGHVDLAAQLGPDGEGLSGGQRRRLGVAQAYLRPPGCCCSTSRPRAWTTGRARALLENLRSALPGTTIIAAIHRPHAEPPPGTRGWHRPARGGKSDGRAYR
jgi:ABC-type transport system involved in cytochrome bd biosynthesis fused ATPase/permease subunit